MDKINTVLQGVAPKVTADINALLEQPFIADDIESALSQMCPTKALGPDGLQTIFFQRHWESVKERMIATCLYVLNQEGTIAPLNHTYIALIPQNNKPRKVTEYKPISLCNVIYRLVTKVIANRLKQILH